jgi:hypothetical protein
MKLIRPWRVEPKDIFEIASIEMTADYAGHHQADPLMA